MATKGQKLLLATPTLVVAESVAAIAHGGGIGAIVAFGAAGLAYAYADEISAALRRGNTSTGSAVLKEPNKQAIKSLGYRLLNGKSVREERNEADQEPEDKKTRVLTADDFDLAHMSVGSFAFSELLATGWRPSYEQIFLARLEDGTNVFITVEQACHIALAGSTRQGKTSIIRQLLLQLCSIGCCCILLDPHYTPYDIEINEDWTPYTPYLRFDPRECKSYDKMEQILKYAATTILDKRKKLREQSLPVGVPTFIVIDEYPAIVAERPKIDEYVAILLRQGAKYKIFLCIASQDFQVKTVSPKSGGAIRDNYKTVLYVGGDKTTANVLLDGPVDPTIEPTLGKGPVMLRCDVVKKAALAQTPFTDNQSLYQLLGPSTYQPSQISHRSDEDDMAELQSNHRYGNDKMSQNLEDQARRNGNGNAVTALLEPASEEGVSPQNEAYPPGWDEEKIMQLMGAYLVSKHLDNSLQALDLSTSQRNRDFARGVLQQRGLWKQS